MFSCFCVSKKNSQERKNPFKKQNNLLSYQISNQQIKEKNIIDVSSTFQTPQIQNHKKLQDFQSNQEIRNLKQTTENLMEIKRVISIKDLEDQSYQDSDQYDSQSQDSDTIPYQSKKQPSEVSTPKNIKRIQNKKKEKKENVKQKEMNQVDEYNLQFPFSKTPNQNLIRRYFTIDNEINNFHSKPAIKPQKSNQIKDSIGMASIDYSKYSEIDKQVSSSQILDLDEQMESKLQEMQNNSVHYHQNTVQNCSIDKNNSSKFKPDQQEKKDRPIFKKLHKFQNIENDFVDLEKAQNQIHHNLLKNSNALSQINNKKYTNQQKLQRLINQSQKQRIQIQLNKRKEEDYDLKQQSDVKLRNQIIQQTIQIELQSIIDTDFYFCDKMSVKSPQNLQIFRKDLKDQEDDNQLMDETLQEAENAFDCFSINEQFSRALITHKFDLASKLFQRMTLDQKNKKDPKGCFPVHLAILVAVLNQKCFDLAKKIMYHPDVRLDIQGPTGWSPLQQSISYKHIRLTPNIFVAAHRKKLGLIRNKLAESQRLLGEMRDFYLQLDVKVDSFIPLLSSITPQDTIKITKIGSSLMIDYTLVGYEYLSCKRRDMGFLLNGQSIYALNRSKETYCDLLQQLDKQQIQLLVVESLQCQTKKVQPEINKVQVKQSKSIFDNEIADTINSYKAKKFTLAVDYTSKTQKRMPQKVQKADQQSHNNSLLSHLVSWEKYLQYRPQINIKPKNKNKKIQLQMWLSNEFQFQIPDLLKIFQLFSLCNPLAQIISSFLNQNFSSLLEMKNSFPVKIDVPINFSLYFNLEFKGLKFKNFQKNKLEIEPKLKKCSRKEFQNLAQSKEKRSFALSAFT